ncbi:MAG: hypothetical protein ACLTFB_00515 [Candidatus Phytoplasma pyri]|uniref:hypothetical protein n=1 Tax=Candidatus Phytoplasma pyri TaxID=47566 RepID=UPI003983BC6C
MKIINKRKKTILFLFLILTLILNINIQASLISTINNDLPKIQKEKILNLLDETDNNFNKFNKKFNKKFIINLQTTTSIIKRGLCQVNCGEKNIKELEPYINKLKFLNQKLMFLNQ